jgi:hypothetical protein
MSSKNGAVTMLGLAAVLAAVGAAFAQALPVTLDPNAPQPAPPAVVRALVKGETSGGTCLLRLVPNGVVQGAARCDWSPVLTRVKRWRRSEDCICLLDGGRRLLLAFQASRGGAFRVQGVEPEALAMRLLRATSMPMSR